MFKKYPLVAVPARNGILGGAFASALLLTLFAFHRHPLMIPTPLDVRILLFAVLLVFTLKEYRDYFRQGILSFWEGMIACLILTFAFALITFLAMWIFGSLQPEYVSEYVRMKTAQLKAYPEDEVAKIGKATFDAVLAEMPATTPVSLALLYFSQSFALSFPISIIISLILRRQPKS